MGETAVQVVGEAMELKGAQVKPAVSTVPVVLDGVAEVVTEAMEVLEAVVEMVVQEHRLH